MSPTPQPPWSEEVLKRHGLTPDEYRRLEASIGRAPTWPELGVFSVLWSEHCSYKSSRVHLRRLPTTGPQVILGPGENAGVIDAGDGLAVVFKMESHNHPSFLEPEQGAATGVGGILRDVFTMGARPIALMDALRFGRPDAPRMSYLVKGVVHGIGRYGNCVGVPTVGGDVAFDPSHDGNILVNAMAVGVARADRLFLGRAEGVGNPVFYVGSKTGRDGIHGATMASEEFGSDLDQKRPNVQVGDPFVEKLLIEACLEVMQEDLLVGIQDMGAAGLTSSSAEMAARAGAGLELALDRVPMRETGMTPYDLLLSESQERMLMVCKVGCEARLIELVSKWGLDVCDVGRVTDTGRWVCTWHGEVVADIPVSVLVDDAPKYERPMRAATPPADLTEAERPGVGDLRAALERLLARPTIASKHWVYRQYDHMVRTGTVVRPGQGDAAVVRLPETPRGIAISVGCNGRACALDPYRGAAMAVAEAALNLACVGAVPSATTDCLNFASPERPEVMWSFSQAIDGLADACRALDTPVVSGNVSFYNEKEGRGINPTPMVGLVGLMAEAARARGSAFLAPHRAVVLLGPAAMALGGSEWLAANDVPLRGPLAPLDLGLHRRVVDTLLAAHAAGLVDSAHDVSEGGLAVALAECTFEHGVGAELTLPPAAAVDVQLFGEGPSTVLVSTTDADALVAAARAAEVPAFVLGLTGGARLVLRDAGNQVLIDAPVDGLREVWSQGFEAVLK
jgi:phosphoribosylformylglycinamidine synthase